MTTFSIIIPYYNNHSTILQVLDSIEKLIFTDFEVIIIDDHSDEKLILPRTFSFPATLIRNTVNKGGGHTRNQGAKIAKGDILLFTDADVTLPEDTLTKIQAIFLNTPHLAAVIGSYKKNTPPKNTITQFKNLFHHYNHQTARENASTFWTGCGAIKANIFKEMNMFSEDRIITPIEDIDLGYRLSKKGYAIRLAKDLQVTHLKTYHFKDFIFSDLFERAIPWTTIILNQKTIPNDLNTSHKYHLSVMFTFITIAAMLSLVVYPIAIYFGLLSLVAIVYLNKNFYILCYREKGILFSAVSILLTFIHFICCGLGFIGGLILKGLKNDR